MGTRKAKRPADDGGALQATETTWDQHDAAVPTEYATNGLHDKGDAKPSNGGLSEPLGNVTAHSAETSVPVVTKFRNRRFKPKMTLFVPVEHCPTVADVLGAGDGALREIDRPVRLVLVGAPPFVGIEPTRRWATAGVPGYARTADRGHYFDGHEPMFHYVVGATPVEIMTASTWFGDGAYTAQDCSLVWSWLGDEIERRFPGGSLLSTPATTGRDLFVRSLGDREFPVLSDELQELIRSTSGQGRIETFVSESAPDRIKRFIEYDARIAYAACCNELGHGTPTRDTLDDFDPYARARYRVDFTVPADWDHVGLLGVKSDDGRGWEWPNEPRRQGSTWVDGAELLIARRAGWETPIRERLVFPSHRGRPLDTWVRNLLQTLDAGTRAMGSDVTRAMMRAAVRGMILHGVGAFHGRTHKVSRSGPREAVPANAQGVSLDTSSGLFQWTEPGRQAWPELAHPEWSAAVWGRARARLLVAPDVTRGLSVGMLSVPFNTLIACRTDAIYMSDDPRWQDDNRVGRYRKAFDVEGDMPRPRSNTDVLDLKSWQVA